MKLPPGRCGECHRQRARHSMGAPPDAEAFVARELRRAGATSGSGASATRRAGIYASFTSNTRRAGKIHQDLPSTYRETSARCVRKKLDGRFAGGGGQAQQEGAPALGLADRSGQLAQAADLPLLRLGRGQAALQRARYPTCLPHGVRRYRSGRASCRAPRPGRDRGAACGRGAWVRRVAVAEGCYGPGSGHLGHRAEGFTGSGRRRRRGWDLAGPD
jgi:hypothetical protein